MENATSVIAQLNTWNDQGRFAEALAEADALLANNPDEAGLFVVRGNALYGLGRFEEALTAYETAIRLDTGDVQARANYGAALFALGRYVPALNACDAAVLTDPEFAPAYINVAHCLAELGHDDEAAEALWQAYSLSPTNIAIGQTAAAMAADLGAYEMARDIYFELSDNPSAPDDLPQTIHDFFMTMLRNGISRPQIMKDVDTWRQKGVRNPDVLRLAGELLKG